LILRMVVMRAIPLFEEGTVPLGMTPIGTKRIGIHKPLRDNGDERSTSTVLILRL